MRKVIATLAVVVGFGLVAAVPASAAVPQKSAPRACTKALNKAEALIDLSVEGFGLASEGFMAVSDLDVARLDSLLLEIEALTTRVTDARLAYDVQAILCRGV
jgi:hypothetical protein